MLEAYRESFTATDNVTHTSASQHQHTASQNASSREGCIKVVFSEMEYLPWNNPDNIVSAEVENVAHQIQFNVLGLLFLIGAPANVINMMVFRKQGLKDRVNLCLFTLSLSDLLFLIIFMCLYGEQLHIQFTTKEQFGPMTRFIFNYNVVGFAAFGYVSGIVSATIATERCLCVFNPLKFRRLLRTRTMAAIIIVVYIVVLGLFFIVVFRYRIRCLYDPTSGEIVTTFVDGKLYKAHKQFIDGLDSFIFGGGLPGSVLVVVTTTTILTIVKLRQIVTWRTETCSTISTREVALTKMLVVNSLIFIIFFSPDALNHLSRHLIPEMRSGGHFHNLFLTMLWIGDTFAFFNATLNIFVYYAMGSRYRETLWSLFGRKLGSDKIRETSTKNDREQNFRK